MTSPSALSRDRASRTAPRLASDEPAISFMRNLLPGMRRQERMSAWSLSNIRSDWVFALIRSCRSNFLHALLPPLNSDRIENAFFRAPVKEALKIHETRAQVILHIEIDVCTENIFSCRKLCVIAKKISRSEA